MLAEKSSHITADLIFLGGGKLGGSEKNRLITAGAKNDNPLSDFTLSLLKVVFFWKFSDIDRNIFQDVFLLCSEINVRPAVNQW